VSRSGSCTQISFLISFRIISRAAILHDTILCDFIFDLLAPQSLRWCIVRYIEKDTWLAPTDQITLGQDIVKDHDMTWSPWGRLGYG
jgi:hypothetical protein